MLKKLFYFTIFLSFGLLFFLRGKPIFAQGTFKCTFGISTKNCLAVPSQDNCEAGYLPGDCSTWSSAAYANSCNAPHPCIAADLATSKCANKVQSGLSAVCPAGFPIDCLPSGFTCCVDNESCNSLPKPAIYTCGIGEDKYGIDTALGCIPASSLNEFIAWFLSKLIFVASGIAFLLMAFGAIKIITSAGSPESIQAGKQLITSSLAGLIFIILSLFILKLIGVDILQIPGFGTP